jgi:hypothetical protein
MSNKNTCILLYSNQQGLEQDIRKLLTHDFDMSAVSIVGTRQSHRNHIAGPDASDHFSFHEFGTLIAAGAIVHLLIKEHEDTAVISGLSVLAQALLGIGIPMDSIRQYEKSVNSGDFLLIVHGSHNDVERACLLLHSESQQVTVHMA